MIYLLAILLLISALSKAVSDTPWHTFSESVFKKLGAWWKSDGSGKWKNGDKSQGEKFPGSSTVFVMITDGAYFFQHFFLFCNFLSFIIYAQIHPVISWLWYVTDFALIYAYFTIIFQVFYWIFNRK